MQKLLCDGYAIVHAHVPDEEEEEAGCATIRKKRRAHQRQVRDVEDDDGAARVLVAAPHSSLTPMALEEKEAPERQIG